MQLSMISRFPRNFDHRSKQKRARTYTLRAKSMEPRATRKPPPKVSLLVSMQLAASSKKNQSFSVEIKRTSACFWMTSSLKARLNLIECLPLVPSIDCCCDKTTPTPGFHDSVGRQDCCV